MIKVKATTPQARATSKEALELGATLIEMRLDEIRERSKHTGNPEGEVLYAIQCGVAAGRLREMAEAQE